MKISVSSCRSPVPILTTPVVDSEHLRSQNISKSAFSRHVNITLKVGSLFPVPSSTIPVVDLEHLRSQNISKSAFSRHVIITLKVGSLFPVPILNSAMHIKLTDQSYIVSKPILHSLMIKYSC